MSDLYRAIVERHSTRMFLPRPVPRAVVDEALTLAQRAPSNSNISRGGWCSSAGPPAIV
jgi:nitroreductase